MDSLSTGAWSLQNSRPARQKLKIKLGKVQQCSLWQIRQIISQKRGREASAIFECPRAWEMYNSSNLDPVEKNFETIKQFHQYKGQRFSHSQRKGIVDKSITPGPGSYLRFS